MEMKLSVSVAVVVAVIAGEILSLLWYSDNMPWGRRQTDRYLISALLCDIGLAFLLQTIIMNYWTVRGWEDAAMMSLWLGLLYVCLEAPHVIHNHRSFTAFFFHAVHKVALMFVMGFALMHFKNY